MNSVKQTNEPCVISWHTYMHTYTHTYLHTCIHTYRQTDRQTDRQTGRQAGRQADRQTDRRITLRTLLHKDRYFRRLSTLTLCSFPVLSFCRTDQEFLQWLRVFFFFWRYLQRISLVVSVTAVLEVVINESMSVSSSFMMVRGTNISPIMAWKVSNTLRFFSFSRSNLSLVCFGLLILFRRRWKVIICKSWPLPMSAPRKSRVLALITPDRKRFLTRM